MNSAMKALAETREDSATQWKTPAERVREFGRHGPRIPTGFPTLDQALRGGFMAGRVVIVGGAPSAGKTSFIVYLAHDFRRNGHEVAILAADEDAEGLLIRWGQQDGFAREDLETGNESVKDAFASNLESIPFDLVDADEVGAVVEDVAEKLARRASEKTGILFVDSVQMARGRGTGADMGLRERIDSVLRALSVAAKKYGLLVIATSELSRAAYAGNVRPVNDLAAFKESGGIEYGAAVALVIRSWAHDPHVLEIGIPKNRLGSRASFWVNFDPERATFREVDAPVHVPRSATSKRSTSASERVLSVLSTGEVFPNRNALSTACGANRTRTLEAIRALIREGIIIETKDGLSLARQGSESVPVPVPPYRGENREPNEPTAAVPVPVPVPGTGNQEKTSTERVKGRPST